MESGKAPILNDNVGLINLKQLTLRQKSLGVPNVEILQPVLSYMKKRNNMNEYVRNTKIFQMVKDLLVNFRCVTKLDLTVADIYSHIHESSS